ncbi:hypothetical protein ACOSP7_019233 [Xanthoceras sorbifolium]
MQSLFGNVEDFLGQVEAATEKNQHIGVFWDKENQDTFKNDYSLPYKPTGKDLLKGIGPQTQMLINVIVDEPIVMPISPDGPAPSITNGPVVNII